MQGKKEKERQSSTTKSNYTRSHGGLRALISQDGGHSWTGAGSDYGFPVDPLVYGYSRGIELPDGSLYLVFQGTGGHKTGDARSMAIYEMRLRVSPDGRSVQPLP